MRVDGGGMDKAKNLAFAALLLLFVCSVMGCGSGDAPSHSDEEEGPPVGTDGLALPGPGVETPVESDTQQGGEPDPSDGIEPVSEPEPEPVSEPDSNEPAVDPSAEPEPEVEPTVEPDSGIDPLGVTVTTASDLPAMMPHTGSAVAPRRLSAP